MTRCRRRQGTVGKQKYFSELSFWFFLNDTFLWRRLDKADRWLRFGSWRKALLIKSKQSLVGCVLHLGLGFDVADRNVDT